MKSIFCGDKATSEPTRKCGLYYNVKRIFSKNASETPAFTAKNGAFGDCHKSAVEKNGLKKARKTRPTANFEQEDYCPILGEPERMSDADMQAPVFMQAPMSMQAQVDTQAQVGTEAPSDMEALLDMQKSTDTEAPTDMDALMNTDALTDMDAPSGDVVITPDASRIMEECTGLISEFESYMSRFSTDEGKDTAELIQSRLTELLIRNGAQLIMDDKEFDILRHTAVSAQTVKNGALIKEFIRPGIRLGNKVYIRAQVKV